MEKRDLRKGSLLKLTLHQKPKNLKLNSLPLLSKPLKYKKKSQNYQIRKKEKRVRQRRVLLVEDKAQFPAEAKVLNAAEKRKRIESTVKRRRINPIERARKSIIKSAVILPAIPQMMTINPLVVNYFMSQVF